MICVTQQVYLVIIWKHISLSSGIHAKESVYVYIYKLEKQVEKKYININGVLDEKLNTSSATKVILKVNTSKEKGNLKKGNKNM